MNPYGYVADLMHAVHDGLLSWARDLLQQANLETVEVYGQFPPEGTVASHLTLFPYWVGPTPKLVESGQAIPLLKQVRYGDGKISFVPEAWRILGRALGEGVSPWFADAVPQVGSARRTFPYPALSALPKPIAGWYAKQADDQGNPWVVEYEGEPHALPPSLEWSPGIHTAVRYVAIASDPGRGTSQYSSTAAPLALPTLSVLAAAIHLERNFPAVVPSPPVTSDFSAFGDAVAESVDDSSLTKTIRDAFGDLRSDEPMRQSISTVHDLSNQEFALLMQALQRPLQAALNIQVRVVLGAHPRFSPASVPSVQTTNAAPRPAPERAVR